MFGHVPLPPPVNQTLSRHNVIWQPTVTIYSDDIYPRACLGRTLLEHVRARTPDPDQASLGMYPPYYLSIKMILYIAITHAEKLSRIFNLSTSSRM